MSTANNGQELAYPFVETREMQGESISFGLTKREHFAALAMQGLCANTAYGDAQAEFLAKWSVDQADALLRALSTPPKEP